MASSSTTAPTSLTSSWPWWWWIPVAGGCAIILIVVVSVCICCCCRRYHRKTRQCRARGSGESGCQTEDLELQDASHFRRMNSSTARRYLLNVVSVFSWGSEFNGEDSQVPAERRPGASGNHDYMNPKDLNPPPPPRPPKKGLRPPSGQHYLNLGKAPPALEPRTKNDF